MADVHVRPAAMADLRGVAAIYAAATRTPASFDLQGHDPAWWEAALRGADPAAGHWLLVAVAENGVLGYARSTRHRPKPAYDTTVETSVYVDEDHRGAGVGHALYAELLARLDRSDRRLAVAGVAQPNPASHALHRAHGFTVVGTFHAVGVKLGRAWDVRWYERPLRGAPALERGG